MLRKRKEISLYDNWIEEMDSKNFKTKITHKGKVFSGLVKSK